jgi:hypothetical protein
MGRSRQTLLLALLGAATLLIAVLLRVSDQHSGAAASAPGRSEPSNAATAVVEAPVESLESRPTLDSASPIEREAVAIALSELRAQLTLRVVDSAGSPVLGARAWIEDENAPPDKIAQFAKRYRSDVHELEAGLGREVPLDADASARFDGPLRAVRLAARAPGLAGCTVVARGDRECVLTLTPSHDLEVFVLGPGDRPVAGAFVALRSEDWDRVEITAEARPPVLGAPSITARTDQTGRAVLRDVEGQHDMRFETWLDVLFVRSEPELVEIAAPLLAQNKAVVFRIASYGSLLVEPVAPADGSGSIATRIELLPDRLLLGQRIPWPTAAVEHGAALFPCVGIGEQLIVRRADSPSFITVDAPSPSAHGEVARFRADFTPPPVERSPPPPPPPAQDSQR